MSEVEGTSCSGNKSQSAVRTRPQHHGHQDWLAGKEQDHTSGGCGSYLPYKETGHHCVRFIGCSVTVGTAEENWHSRNRNSTGDLEQSQQRNC